MAIKTLGAVMETAADGYYKADVSKVIDASKETETTVKTLAADDLERVSGGKSQLQNLLYRSLIATTYDSTM